MIWREVESDPPYPSPILRVVFTDQVDVYVGYAGHNSLNQVAFRGWSTEGDYVDGPYRRDRHGNESRNKLAVTHWHPALTLPEDFE